MKGRNNKHGDNTNKIRTGKKKVTKRVHKENIISELNEKRRNIKQTKDTFTNYDAGGMRTQGNNH